MRFTPLAAFILCTSYCSAQINQWIKIEGRDYINQMTSDCDQIWISTNEGLILYNDQTHTTTFYNTGNTTLRSNLISSVSISLSGAKYVCTTEGIYVMNGDEFKRLNASKPYSAEVDFQENVWFIGTDNLLNKYIISDSSSSEIEMFDGKQVIDIASDRNKHLYFLINEPGDSMSIYKYDGSLYQVASTINIPYENKEESGFFVDQENRLWVIFAFDDFNNSGYSDEQSGGISVFDSGSWKHYYANDLGANGFNHICEDGAGMLYVSDTRYNDEELYQFKYDGSINLNSIDNGISDKLWLIDPLNHQWFVEDKTVILFDGTTANYPKISDIPISFSSHVTIDKQNQIWACNYKSIVHWNNDHWDVYDNTNCPVFSEIGLNTISDLHCYGENQLAVCSNRGIYLFDGNTWKTFTESQIGTTILYETMIKCRTDAQGTLWAISNNHLFRYDDVEEDWGNYNSDDQFVEKISDMEIFDSVLFITGTDVKKMNIYENWLTWNFPGADGFPLSPDFTSISSDTSGNFWFCGSKGIYKLSNGITEKISSRNVYKMVIDKSTDEKYFLDFDYTFHKFVNPDSIFEYTSENSGYAFTLDIASDQDNNILMAADGIMVFNEYGIKGDYTESNYFPANIPDAYCRGYLEETPEMFLFPNPADELLNITMNITNDEKTMIKIFNAAGMQVSATEFFNTRIGISNFTVDTSHLIKGIYLIQITNGDEITGKQFIKL